MNSIIPSYSSERTSRIAKLLDIVERGCVHYMRVGGGGLIGTNVSAQVGKAITPKMRQEIARRAAAGEDMWKIAADLEVSYNSVARHSRSVRGVKGNGR